MDSRYLNLFSKTYLIIQLIYSKNIMLLLNLKKCSQIINTTYSTLNDARFMLGEECKRC